MNEFSFIKGIIKALHVLAPYHDLEVVLGIESEIVVVTQRDFFKIIGLHVGIELTECKGEEYGIHRFCV